MRHPLLEGVVAVAGGVALYGAAAGIGVATGAGPVLAAILEESLKVGLLFMAGWLGIRDRRVPASSERNPARQIRFQYLGLARGLSLGLVSIAVFAGIENLAYLLAFPESGILARLLWSLPVHLVAALLEALGVLVLLRSGLSAKRASILRRMVPPLAGVGCLVLAMAWHGGANHMLMVHFTQPVFAAGSGVAILLTLILLMQFLRHAYLGGFLHGAD